MKLSKLHQVFERAEERTRLQGELKHLPNCEIVVRLEAPGLHQLIQRGSQYSDQAMSSAVRGAVRGELELRLATNARQLAALGVQVDDEA